MTNSEKGVAMQLTLPIEGEDMERCCGTDNNLPQMLMNWLCCKAAEGSAYINLAGGCDGRRGTLVLTCYDKNDRCLAEEVHEMHTTEYLLAA